jgi:protein-S-isoprenylcysteine O-methyltransferase Ste14
LGPSLRSHCCGDQLVFWLVQAARLSARISGDFVGRDLGILPVWALVLFRREGTEVEPTSPTNRKLITSGPYQFTRNPMYLGLVILTLGIAIWVGAWPMFGAPIALFATANWVHIPFEEAKMRRQFGAAYDNYVARVRRWI